MCAYLRERCHSWGRLICQVATPTFALWVCEQSCECRTTPCVEPTAPTVAGTVAENTHISAAETNAESLIGCPLKRLTKPSDGRLVTLDPFHMERPLSSSWNQHPLWVASTSIRSSQGPDGYRFWTRVGGFSISFLCKPNTQK